MKLSRVQHAALTQLTLFSRPLPLRFRRATVENLLKRGLICAGTGRFSPDMGYWTVTEAGRSALEVSKK